MNISKVLSVIATITELLVPGHPTCKIAGQLANDTDTLPIVTLRLKDLQYIEELGGDPYEYLKYKKITSGTSNSIREATNKVSISG